jgi:methylthioribose-1-phosphate isomerase
MSDAARDHGDDLERLPEDLSVRRIQKRIGTNKDVRDAETMPEVMARAVVALWTRGANYPEIADEFGISVATARMAVERVLADSLDDNEDKTKQRQRVALQLDAFLRSVVDKALDQEEPEQLSYLRAAMQVVDRKARLLGLDAPINVQLGLPSKDELDQWVAAVAAANGSALPVEGDPFEEITLEQDPETGEWLSPD